MIECVVNVERGTTTRGGRRPRRRGRRGPARRPHLRATTTARVLTLVGEDAPRAVARTAVELHRPARPHAGPIPASGCSTWCPSCPLGVHARCGPSSPPATQFAAWAAAELGPAVLRLRARAHRCPRSAGAPSPRWRPTPGPTVPAPLGRGGGRRRPPVARRLQPLARRARPRRRPAALAASVRGARAVRALGLAVGDQVQVSMNLIDPTRVGPADVWDRVGRRGDDRPGRAGGPGARGRAGPRAVAPLGAARPRRGSHHRGAAGRTRPSLRRAGATGELSRGLVGGSGGAVG